MDFHQIQQVAQEGQSLGHHPNLAHTVPVILGHSAPGE